MKYLHWKTVAKLMRELSDNDSLDNISIDKAGDFTFLVDFPSGEHIEFWLWPGFINGSVRYNKNGKLGYLLWKKHREPKNLALAVFNVIKNRKTRNNIENDFYNFLVSWIETYEDNINNSLK